MRNEALDLMKEQLACVKHDVEACEIEMVDCMEDPDAIEALKAVQMRFKATADELKSSIKKLR
jgi:hypothetical protein